MSSANHEMIQYIMAIFRAEISASRNWTALSTSAEISRTVYSDRRQLVS
jgi:hypothetical protein